MRKNVQAAGHVRIYARRIALCLQKTAKDSAILELIQGNVQTVDCVRKPVRLGKKQAAVTGLQSPKRMLPTAKWKRYVQKA